MARTCGEHEHSRGVGRGRERQRERRGGEVAAKQRQPPHYLCLHRQESQPGDSAGRVRRRKGGALACVSWLITASAPPQKQLRLRSAR